MSIMTRLLLFVAVAFAARNVHADGPLTSADLDLSKKARAILRESCFKCHSHEANRSRGGLVVDSRESLLKGGDSGPAVVSGDPAVSSFIRAVRHDGDLRMPPKAKLADSDIAILTAWVKRGLPWPDDKKAVAGRFVPGTITDDDRKWWAFQPVRPQSPPPAGDDAWKKNPIDRFVFARLQREGLKPSPPAEKLSILRRVSFDVTGLPPTPAEIAAFVNDPSADAYEKLVERLLSSPRYGEKWARHWLDVVRYAESDGYRLDEYRPNAWRYRDYVIRSLNADKPFDRFTQEQLAGDELFPGDADALAGTAFLRHWIYEYNQRDVRVQWQSILDDVTEVTGEAFLGLGMGCARCHDHKYDPILQKDFFRLQAFFAGIQPSDYEPLVTPAARSEYENKLAAWKTAAADVRAKIDEWKRKERAAAEDGAIKKFQPDIQAMILKADSERTPLEKQLAALAYRQVTYELDKVDKRFVDSKDAAAVALREQLAKFDELKPKPLPAGFAIRDVGPKASPVMMTKRKAAEEVAPDHPEVLGFAAIDIVPQLNGTSTGRRAALAKWLTRPDHPLTARVIVNRIWQQYFGHGLVRTPSDFGRLGEPPSHPELLDWLATDFVQNGWSLKRLHRQILLSQTYRQSATRPASKVAMQTDPENRLLWRGTIRRLQAEQIRDAVLAVSGQLDLAEAGPSVDAVKSPRRSIYTKLFRNNRDAFLDTFDAPEGVASTGLRNVTTTPLQALLLINGPFLMEQAKAFAMRIENAGDDAAKVDLAFKLAFGRPPTAGETRRALEFVTDQANRAGGSGAAWADLCHALLSANEFLYVD